MIRLNYNNYWNFMDGFFVFSFYISKKEIELILLNFEFCLWW